MVCDRCGKETAGTIGSMFNMESICFDCKYAEKQHPLYREASRIESEAVSRGDYNYPGIGLPYELRPKFKLWHDDVRPPPDDSWDAWARTNDEARELLATGKVTHCSLDHDLGMDEVELPNDTDAALDILIEHQKRASETGLDLVHWMVEEGCVPGVVRIHSWNPAGAQNMAARLNQYGYSCTIEPFKEQS